MALPVLRSSLRVRRNVVMQLFVASLVLITFYSLLTTDRQVIKDYADASLDFFKPLEKHSLNLEHLKEFNITDKFTYSRRTINTKRAADLHPRPILTTVDETLHGPIITVNSKATDGDLSNVVVPIPDPLTLEVPSARTLSAQMLSFGIATTIERLNDSVPQFMHWLPHSGAQLHVVVPEDNVYNYTEDWMNSLGMDVNISTANEKFAINYFKHIKELYDRRTEQTKWIVLIDDDTFFPSLPDMVYHLKSHYNHREPTLVAPVSDDFGQITKHGLMPFGGGGVFLSLPLVEKLIEPVTFEACLNTDKYEGDQILADCISKHTMVKPSFDFGLHQMDLKGDVSGFYESGREPLTLHHWKSWHMANLTAMAEVSKACGNNCLLQRWRFKDNAILSNGYSIVNYPTLKPNVYTYIPFNEKTDPIEIDFQAMEKTWDGDMARFEHTHSPLRPPLAPDADKVSFRLLKSTETEEDVTQTYGHRREGSDWIDGVLELVWTK